MGAEITSRLWNVINGVSTYNFVENPLPVFFMLYAKKHGMNFSFDSANKILELNHKKDLLDNEIIFVSVMKNSNFLFNKAFEDLKQLYCFIYNEDYEKIGYTPVFDFLIEKYAVLGNMPILSKNLKSLAQHCAEAFYNNYSTVEGEEDARNIRWVDTYFFVDSQKYDPFQYYNAMVIQLLQDHLYLSSHKVDIAEEQTKILSFLEEVKEYDFYSTNSSYEKIENLMIQDKSVAATLCFSKDFCETEEFKALSVRLLDKDMVDFAVELPPLTENQQGLVLLGVSNHNPFYDVLFIDARNTIEENAIQWDLINGNISLYNRYECKGLEKSFRPDLMFIFDYCSIQEGNEYSLLPSHYTYFCNKIPEEKEFIRLDQVFKKASPIKDYTYSKVISRYNFTNEPVSMYKEFKEIPQETVPEMVRYKGKSIILSVNDFEISICRWNSDEVFSTEKKNLVLQLQDQSPISLDYAAYALLKSAHIQEIIRNMSHLDMEDNWYNFLKCQIPVYKDKVKQEEIVEHLRNEYAQQRKKELAAEMQRLGIRTASSDMIHMLGPTFAKLESTLYDLKSEDLSETAHKAVETLDDNIDYIKRFIKTSGADMLGVRMSFKEQKINQFISSVLKSWNNLSSSRIFEVEYESGISDEVTFKIDESYLRVLFDTLFDNAYRHGFDKKFTPGNKVNITSNIVRKHNQVYVLLSVANNGNPFPEDFTMNKFVSRGEFCGETGRTGLGGNHIYRILQRHNGFLYITKTEDRKCVFEMLIPVEYYNDVEHKNIKEYEHFSECI